MTPRSGTACNAVSPITPNIAYEADNADPGEVARVKAEQFQQEKGKYGTTPVQPHKRAEAETQEDKPSWIEIELIDDDDQPVPGEPYEVTLPDGSLAAGTLDQNGFARIDGIDPGSCQITFPKLDVDAWNRA